MKKTLLYKDLARYYDLIYSWKEYEDEAAKIMDIIEAKKKNDGRELLEVACGTGNHLQYLTKHFACTGVDLNEGMLAIAKKKVPKAHFQRADMAKMRLGKKFDVITCLFSSIGYITEEKMLQKTFDTFAAHLQPGGVLIVEPWHSPATYKVGSPHCTTYQDKDICVTRSSVSELKGNVSIMDMHYLIAERDKKVVHFVDRHQMLLQTPEALVALAKKAGLKARFVKKGLMHERGLLIATL